MLSNITKRQSIPPLFPQLIFDVFDDRCFFFEGSTGDYHDFWDFLRPDCAFYCGRGGGGACPIAVVITVVIVIAVSHTLQFAFYPSIIISKALRRGLRIKKLVDRW